MHQLAPLLFIIGDHVLDLAGDMNRLGYHGTRVVVHWYVSPSSCIKIFDFAQLPINNPTQDGGDDGGYGRYDERDPKVDPIFRRCSSLQCGMDDGTENTDSARGEYGHQDTIESKDETAADEGKGGIGKVA